MPAPVHPFVQQNTVVLNKRSIITSLLLILNVVAMPLKAYISEPPPWHDRSELWDYQENCSISIDLCHQGWDNFFHAHKPAYGVAFGQNYDVLQENLTILPGVRNFTDDQEPDAIFAVFETPVERHSMLQIQSNQVPVTNFSHFNVARIFGVPISYSTSWGEYINGTDPPQPCIWIGFRTAEFSIAWQSFKFVARGLLTLYIAWQTWHNYYRHYVQLTRNLVKFGLPQALPNTEFEVVLGDPTSIILLNPLVTIAFMFDFWLSADFVTRAFMRLTQTQVYSIFLTACLYLSRTVWFAYGALGATSYVLKRYKKENCFSEIDPSIVAIVVSIVAGPLTCLQFRVYFFFSIYRFLFSFMLSSEKINEGYEIAAASFVFSYTLGSMPVIYGFLHKKLTSKSNHVLTALTTQKTKAFLEKNFASLSFNDWKHRFLLWCIGRSFSSTKKGSYLAFGGGVYDLFVIDCKYKRNACMSQRGADCYVIFKYEQKTISVRLSLIQVLDPKYIIEIPSMSSAVGEVLLESISSHDAIATIRQGADACCWVM